MSHILPLTAKEVERRLLKVADLAVHPAVQEDSDIKVILDHFIEDGSEIKFKAPVDCSAVSRLLVQYIDGEEVLSKKFAFADANGNDVGELNNLFAEGSIVKVILDLDPDIDGEGTAIAFVQNADTNAYLEERFDNVQQDLTSLEQTIAETVEQELVEINNELSNITNNFENKLNNVTAVQIITWDEYD